MFSERCSRCAKRFRERVLDDENILNPTFLRIRIIIARSRVRRYALLYMAAVEQLPAAQNLALPLPLHTCISVGTLTGKDGTPFTVLAGLDEKLVAQLKEKSLDMSDTELQHNTSDKARFGTGSYEAWYAKDRTPFAAVDASGNLAAIIWFGADMPPALVGGTQYPTQEKWDTIAFRSYAPYRGAGLMGAMSAFVIEMQKRTRSAYRLWLETNVDNIPGQGLFHKLGFEDIGTSERPGPWPGRRSGNGRLVMVYKGA